MDRYSRVAGRRLLPLLLLLAARAHAGPLGPLPNATTASEETEVSALSTTVTVLPAAGCAMGDAVYGVGDEVPSGPCERCLCAGAGASGGNVTCTRTACDQRPGCKALHRPDHCCPIYQCECEQEGRVYGNGEKLVDPLDPCRVCYCQGGEVVCRRIACFVRDDCSPRHVPGRCCPEYDNCPLRGVTAIPGVAPTISTESSASSPAPPPPKESVKQEITIKEITPVSEIPILPEVKIKEILPSPSIEVTDYSSSKSPLIVREATSEKPFSSEEPPSSSEPPVPLEEVQFSSSLSSSSEAPLKIIGISEEAKTSNDSPPSKISLSTQDSINSEIYPAIQMSASTSSEPSIASSDSSMVTTKAPVMDEEDPTLFDHNPAFPPLPDDLSDLRNHEEEILPEQNPEEHVSETQEPVSVPSTSQTPQVTTDMPLLTTRGFVEEIPIATTSLPVATINPFESSTALNAATDPSTAKEMSTANNLKFTDQQSTLDPTATDKSDATSSTQSTSLKSSPMLNLRTAITTEILDVPSLVPEEITGEVDSHETTSADPTTLPSSSLATENIAKIVESITKINELVNAGLETSPAFKMVSFTTTAVPKAVTETLNVETTKTQTDPASVSVVLTTQKVGTSSASKPSETTDFTVQTEFSSLPVETSDQNPQETSENNAKEIVFSTENPSTGIVPKKISEPLENDVPLSSKAPSTTSQSLETTKSLEFTTTSFGSSEIVTEPVELISMPAKPEKSASLIEPTRRKNDVLTDLFDLVGDVAAIGDHVETVGTTRYVTKAPSSVPESEELIPVNEGYKSKNNNWNLNSITETIPTKTKSQGSKQRVVEIEGEDLDIITDSAPPHDKVEPTTRRPIIDNVSDEDTPMNRTQEKEIEIIRKSYVPTINRRPTKVVMKKSNEKPLSEETATEDSLETTFADVTAASATVDAESSTAFVESDKATGDVFSASGASYGTTAESKVTSAELTSTPAESRNTPVSSSSTASPSTTTGSKEEPLAEQNAERSAERSNERERTTQTTTSAY